MDWDLLRVFLAVAEAGSFTRAGRAVALSQSAVSRRVARLARSVGVSLFHRHPRGFRHGNGQRTNQVVWPPRAN